MNNEKGFIVVVNFNYYYECEQEVGGGAPSELRLKVIHLLKVLDSGSKIADPVTPH